MKGGTHKQVNNAWSHHPTDNSRDRRVVEQSSGASSMNGDDLITLDEALAFIGFCDEKPTSRARV
ncbi:hypothetical protein GQ600_11223 [Phytophthora cactorum]|nr:hypothetical protein GQ600_11223 [Phytophthora cactorum]